MNNYTTRVLNPSGNINHSDPSNGFHRDPCMSRDTLCIENLPGFINETHLCDVFGRYGRIVDIQLNKTVEQSTEFSLIRFGNHEAASRALWELNGYILNGHPLRLSWAKLMSTPSMNTSNTSNLFRPRTTVQVLASFIARDLQVIVNEEFLQNVFSRFGKVVYVDVKKSNFDMNNSIQTGYSFIHFEDSSDGIRAAFQTLNVVQNVVINGVAFDCRMSSSMRQRFSRSDIYHNNPYGQILPQKSKGKNKI